MDKNERLAKVKAYFIDHAPDLITATCAVTITTVSLVALNRHADNLKIAQQAIHVLKNEGRDFTYYPGIGIFLETVEAKK